MARYLRSITIGGRGEDRLYQRRKNLWGQSKIAKVHSTSEKCTFKSFFNNHGSKNAWWTFRNKWVNWINDLKKVEDYEERKKFLNGVVDKIYVETIDKQNHKLDIQFNSPFVNDSLVWNEVGKPKKGYKVIEGIKNYSFNHQQTEGPQKGIKKNKRIWFLKVLLGMNMLK